MPAPAQQPEPEPVEAEISNHAQKAHSVHLDVAFLVGEVAFFIYIIKNMLLTQNIEMHYLKISAQ